MRSYDSLSARKPRALNLQPLPGASNRQQQQEHAVGSAQPEDTNNKLEAATRLIFLESGADALPIEDSVIDAFSSAMTHSLPVVAPGSSHMNGKNGGNVASVIRPLPMPHAGSQRASPQEDICIASTQAFPVLVVDKASCASQYEAFSSAATHPLSSVAPTASSSPAKEDILSPASTQVLPITPARLARQTKMPVSRVVVLAAFLFIVILQASSLGLGQFVGIDGWAYVLGDPANSNNQNLLSKIEQQLQHQATPGTRTTPQVITPQQIIDLLMQNMTLDQKIGQMMLVQFVGPDYSLPLSTMVRQENVGAVLLYSANGNIIDKTQLKGLAQQMQSNASIPLLVSIDQEGGTVDRLANLDGPRPSASSIGATNNPANALAAGIQDAKDLSSYGINLNLAPVVDVTNVYNAQLYLRTFGNNPAIVTGMAGAYLRGLQQSGKVLGTIKHFPGLGDVGVDPHTGLPRLSRSQSELEAIDWAPYRALIKQGNVHAVMVTHEIVPLLDSVLPSSLSPKLVTGILRNDLGFQGVIVTDSLTMQGIAAFYTEPQAAVLAIKAGCDLLMGAASPDDVAAMVQGIRQAISTGQLSEQRIDQSVQRILLLKYEAGLLHLPTN